MSFLTGLSPFLSALGAGAAGYYRGQNLGNEENYRRSLDQYQIKRQQEQDRLRQALAEREANQRDQQMQLQALIHGAIPQGAPSRAIPELNAVPLPERATVSPESDFTKAEPIEGAHQRQAELEFQDAVPGIEIGGQRFAPPLPKPVKLPAPVRGEIRETDQGLFEIDPITGKAKPVTTEAGGTLKGYHPEKTPARNPQTQWTDAQGQIHRTTVDDNGNVVNDVVLGQGKVGGAGGAGTGSASGAQVPVADMQARFAEVQQHAEALGRGEWKITQPMQIREGAEYSTARDAAKGDMKLRHTGLAAVSSAMGLGGKDYEHYQAMMNSYRALGDDVAKVFKGRQNEEAVLREVALAQLTPQDYRNPAVVQQKLNRLKHVIDLAALNNPGQAPLLQSGAAPQAGEDPRIVRLKALRDRAVKAGADPVKAEAVYQAELKKLSRD